MKKLGVEQEWRGQLQISQSMEAKSLTKLYALSRVVKRQREVKRMNQVNWTTLLPGLISATKLVLQSFGIDIPDEHINATVNGVAAVGAIVAIFMSHNKGETNAQYKGDSGSAV